MVSTSFMAVRVSEIADLDSAVMLGDKIESKRRELVELLLQKKRLDDDRKKQCDHLWDRRVPDGPRDNGEFYYVCQRCGDSR